MTASFVDEINFNSNNIALVENDKKTSYRELAERVKAIEKILELNGLYKESVVAIFLDRSVDMIATQIAVLKQRIVYIPIDTSFPLERIEYIISNSKCNAIITQQSYTNMFKQYKTVILDMPNFFQTNESSNNTKPTICCDDQVSYILYTSGSTGRPKGVMIKLDSLNNFILGITRKINIKNCHTIICLASFSFDIFFLETMFALFHGLTIVLTSNKECMNVRQILRLIIKYAVDIIQITPSRLQQIILYDRSLSSFKSVKNLLIGGEALPLNLLNICQQNSCAEIYNLYGPTETTIWSSVANLTNSNVVDIGVPINETFFKVINNEQCDVEKNATGELLIAGDGVMVGYAHNEKLTNEKLVKMKDGLIYYKTGDLVKLLENGLIVYIGRKDNQVKLNGYRIELEEIEKAVERFDSIDHCIVKVESQGMSNFINCYYTSQSRIENDLLSKFLQSELPYYMIPRSYCQIPQMPLNTNGKIDRQLVGVK